MGGDFPTIENVEEGEAASAAASQPTTQPTQNDTQQNTQPTQTDTQQSKPFASIASDDDMSVEQDVVSDLMEKYQAQVGGVLADHWLLPSAVKDTILGIAGQGDGSKDIVATVKAARTFAACTIADRNYDEAALSANAKIVEINLYADDVRQLLAKSDSVHDTISALSL